MLRYIKSSDGGPLPNYPVTTGFRMFDEASLTGLNRSPVTKLLGYILSGASVTGSVPWQLDDLARMLLLSGSLLAIDDVFQPDVISAGPNSVAIAVYGKNNYTHFDIARVYTQAESGWTITDIRSYGTEFATIVEQQTGEFPGIKYYYNALSPTGILYPAQYTYRRLEEIERGLRKLQSGPSVKTIIHGHVMNRDTAKEELNSDSPYAFVPGEVKIDKSGDTSAVDQMLSEYHELLGLYRDQTYTVDMQGDVQRPSSTDRKLVLGPMMRFVERTRDKLTEILSQYSAEWTYERIHTSDVAERVQALELYRQLATDDSANKAYYLELIRKLA